MNAILADLDKISGRCLQTLHMKAYLDLISICYCWYDEKKGIKEHGLKFIQLESIGITKRLTFFVSCIGVRNKDEEYIFDRFELKNVLINTFLPKIPELLSLITPAVLRPLVQLYLPKADLQNGWDCWVEYYEKLPEDLRDFLRILQQQGFIFDVSCEDNLMVQVIYQFYLEEGLLTPAKNIFLTHKDFFLKEWKYQKRVKTCSHHDVLVVRQSMRRYKYFLLPLLNQFYQHDRDEWQQLVSVVFGSLSSLRCSNTDTDSLYPNETLDELRSVMFGLNTKDDLQYICNNEIFRSLSVGAKIKWVRKFGEKIPVLLKSLIISKALDAQMLEAFFETIHFSEISLNPEIMNNWMREKLKKKYDKSYSEEYAAQTWACDNRHIKLLEQLISLCVRHDNLPLLGQCLGHMFPILEKTIYYNAEDKKTYGKSHRKDDNKNSEDHYVPLFAVLLDYLLDKQSNQFNVLAVLLEQNHLYECLIRHHIQQKSSTKVFDYFKKYVNFKQKTVCRDFGDRCLVALWSPVAMN